MEMKLILFYLDGYHHTQSSSCIVILSIHFGEGNSPLFKNFYCLENIFYFENLET